MTKQSLDRGFTLLEILLVVATIAILAGIVIVAINPARQLAETRDAERRSDVEAISSAIIQYQIKNGSLPGTLRSIDDPSCTDKTFNDNYFGICKDVDNCTGISLSSLTASKQFLVTLPIDPSLSDPYFTGYLAWKDSDNRITVCAPLAETATISVTR